jgi:hypothetical protein
MLGNESVCILNGKVPSAAGTARIGEQGELDGQALCRARRGSACAGVATLATVREVIGRAGEQCQPTLLAAALLLERGVDGHDDGLD